MQQPAQPALSIPQGYVMIPATMFHAMASAYYGKTPPAPQASSRHVEMQAPASPAPVAVPMAGPQSNGMRPMGVAQGAESDAD